MYKEKSHRTFGREHAEEWQKISGEREAQFKNKNGIFTYTTIYPDDGDDSDSVQKNADEAMYFIKEKSKNDYAFYDEVVK